MFHPNVLLLIADDLGVGDLGMNNGGLTQTPAMDSLHSDGVALRQSYSASPVCAPARAALLTGRYPHRTGAVTPQEMLGMDRIALDEITLADCFQHAGYATALIGKWHNGALDPRFHPTRRGFDEFFGFCGGWTDYWRWRLESAAGPVSADGRYLTDVLASEAVGFLDRHRHEPFFLTVAFTAPHAPLQAPEALVARHRARGLSEELSHLYAMVESLDDGVARILEALDRGGLAENTIVLLVSDNGPALSVNPNLPRSPGMGTDLRRPNAGLRDGKRSVYEGGIRVPAAIRWPGGLPSSVTDDHLFHFTDWMPTLLGLAGRTRPGGRPFDGRDLTGWLRGGHVDADERHFWQWNLYDPIPSTNAAHRDGRYKLVRPAIAGIRPADDAAAAMMARHRDLELEHVYRPDHATRAATAERPRREVPPAPPPELYDLSLDPFEQHDIAEQHPGLTRRMCDALDSWFDDVEGERSRIDAATGRHH